MDNERLTAKEAAAYLGVNPQRVYNLSHQRRLGQHDEDGYLYFTRTELDEYLVQKATRPKGGRPTFKTKPKKEMSSAAL